jgi:disulfide bond formation protein DsbB
MPAYVDTFNHIVALGTIGLQAVIVLLLLSLICFRSRTNPVLLFFKKHGLLFGFLLALGGVALSLFYSEVIGFPACELCLIQRVFIYPQTLMFGYLLWKPRTKHSRPTLDTSLIFAIFGALVGMYHVYIEHGGSSSLACVTGKAAVSCATRYVYEFGYITIPVMSLTCSLLLILIIVNYKYMSSK